MTAFEPTIGIETHVQLKTKTKLFSAVGNDASEAAPNSLISHIDVGLPGALPVLNEKAVELAVRAAIALGTKPQQLSKFDRKHYFYPDLPKGYQITQHDEPIILGGFVQLPSGQKIGITRVHLEEDAGKNTHPAGADYSLIDLNRAGTPLLEIVSEPEIKSAEQAKEYARELYLLMKLADVSDCDLYLGHMRFDVNVSLSAQSNKLGTRTEIKNLNSFKSVENAVAYEIKRQADLLKKSESIVQETRGWDEAKQKTIPQRGKEEAQDYRYMPEPDIPPIELDDEYIKHIERDEAILPVQWRKKLAPIGLGKAEIESLIDGEAEIERMSYLPLIEDNLDNLPLAKFLADWFLNVVLPLVREGRFKFGHREHLKLEIGLYEMLKEELISSNSARQIFIEIVESDKMPKDIREYVKQSGLIQVSDKGEIYKIVAEVLSENQKATDDVKAGSEKAIGFLVGQVMAKSKGQANPQIAQEIIKKQIGI